MFFLHPPSNPPTPPPHWGAQPFLCPSSPEGLSPRDPNTLTTAKSRPIHGTILSPHYQSSTVQQLQHCMGCECLIMDSQLIKIFPDCFLHEHCAVCSICNTSLMPRRSSHSFSPQWTKCYVREKQLFCRAHYFDYFVPKTICPACNMSIQLDEFACKLKNDIVYHFRCLRCAQCNKKLKRGDRLVLSELCRTIKCAEHIYANANDEWLMAAANGRKAFSRRENAGEGIPGNQLPNAGEGIPGNQLPTSTQSQSEDIVVIQAEGSKEMFKMEGQRRQNEAGGADAPIYATGRKHIKKSMSNLSQSMNSDKEENFRTRQISSDRTSNRNKLSFSRVSHCSSTSPRQHSLSGRSSTDIPSHNTAHQSTSESYSSETTEKRGGNYLLEDKTEKEHTQLEFESSKQSDAEAEESSSSAENEDALSENEMCKKRRKMGKSKQDDGGGDRTSAVHLPPRGRRTNTPGSVPQYPSEMYAVGEQFSREEEDAHQKVHGNKRRGPRTTISQKQLDILNRMFDNFPKPSKHERAKLALDSGLSMRVIQVALDGIGLFLCGWGRKLFRKFIHEGFQIRANGFGSGYRNRT